MGRARTVVNVGDRFGRLTIIEETAPEPRPEPSRSAYRRFRVRCDCGVERNVRLCNIRSGSTSSCGCYAREQSGGRPRGPSPQRVPCPPGTRFGRLTVVQEAPREHHPGQSPTHRRRMACRCDCGDEVIVRLHNLRCGSTLSCGCTRIIHLRNRQPPLRSAAS